MSKARKLPKDDGAHEVPKGARPCGGDGGRRRGTGLGRAVPGARSAVRRGPRAHGGARRQCQVPRGRNLSHKRYHVALQPPCDCWTFGRAAVVEQARGVAESLKAPPLVDTWLDAIAADDTGKLPSIGFGVSADDALASGISVATIYLTAGRRVTADRSASGPGLLGHGLGHGSSATRRRSCATTPSRRPRMTSPSRATRRASASPATTSWRRSTARSGSSRARTSPDGAFQYDKATTRRSPPRRSEVGPQAEERRRPRRERGCRRKAGTLSAPGAEAWLARSRVKTSNESSARASSRCTDTRRSLVSWTRPRRRSTSRSETRSPSGRARRGGGSTT